MTSPSSRKVEFDREERSLEKVFVELAKGKARLAHRSGSFDFDDEAGELKKAISNSSKGDKSPHRANSLAEIRPRSSSFLNLKN